MLFVNMENVDAKPIPFVKGSITDSTREFTIALINASGVFKVAVTVIFVGEHFTTTFT